MTPTNALAPRSGRSSRSTLVITACRRPILATTARHPGRLERVVPRRLARLDVAEAAAAGARVAEDHERRRAALPALADVRARRLLADRVEVLGLDQPLELAVLRAAGRRHLEPRRLARAERLHVGPEDVEHVLRSRRDWPGTGSAMPRSLGARVALVWHTLSPTRHTIVVHHRLMPEAGRETRV